MNCDAQSIEVRCPNCRSAIVDVKFSPSADGGTVSIEHAQPICTWWRSPEARQWAVQLVTDVIVSGEEQAPS